MTELVFLVPVGIVGVIFAALAVGIKKSLRHRKERQLDLPEMRVKRA